MEGKQCVWCGGAGAGESNRNRWSNQKGFAEVSSYLGLKQLLTKPWPSLSYEAKKQL